MRVDERPHVVIVGGGFGGLYAARTLSRSPVRITLIDRSNHHLFQPLLYEVATAALSPADIAAPIRKILSRRRNVTVLMADAESIDLRNRIVHLTDGELSYDYLIVATGATHSYFGHDEWARFAPGLKTLEDALEIRRRFLLAFEAAEREADPDARSAKLTFIIVGGGPTGVELAGTMAELARKAIPRDFRTIDTTTARVILFEAQDRLLADFAPKLAERAKRDLLRLGVDVRLGSAVTKVDKNGVEIAGPPTTSPGARTHRINCENIIWAAGVQAAPLARTLGAAIDKAGRVIVNPDLSVPDYPNAFVIGDLACAKDARTGRRVPGVAPAAMQMGRHVARIIDREVREAQSTIRKQAARPGFRYVDKGILATIGRGKAVGTIKGVHLTGVLAWLLWAIVHISYCITFRNKFFVMLEWAWTYTAFERGARLITGEAQLQLTQPRESAAITHGGWRGDHGGQRKSQLSDETAAHDKARA